MTPEGRPVVLKATLELKPLRFDKEIEVVPVPPSATETDVGFATTVKL